MSEKQQDLVNLVPTEEELAERTKQQFLDDPVVQDVLKRASIDEYARTHPAFTDGREEEDADSYDALTPIKQEDPFDEESRLRREMWGNIHNPDAFDKSYERWKEAYKRMAAKVRGGTVPQGSFKQVGPYTFRAPAPTAPPMPGPTAANPTPDRDWPAGPYSPFPQAEVSAGRFSHDLAVRRGKPYCTACGTSIQKDDYRRAYHCPHCGREFAPSDVEPYLGRFTDV